MKHYFFCYTARDSKGVVHVRNFDAFVEELSLTSLASVVQQHCLRRADEGVFMKEKDVCITSIILLDK